MLTRHSLIAAVALCAIVPALAQDSQQAEAVQNLPATAVYAMVPDARLALGTNLIGAQVNGAANERIGRVANLVVNEEGAVEAAVIAVGGLFGVGEKQIAVTYKSLRIVRNAAGDAIDHVAIAATKNDLRYAAKVLPRYAQQRPDGLAIR
jgi:hypothetical protein